jgi:5-methylcytosine-specific restriction endonuclease McrA
METSNICSIGINLSRNSPPITPRIRARTKAAPPESRKRSSVLREHPKPIGEVTLKYLLRHFEKWGASGEFSPEFGYIFRMAPDYTDFAFSGQLLGWLFPRWFGPKGAITEFPDGSYFVSMPIGDRQWPVLRVPSGAALRFRRRLTRRITAKVKGYPAQKLRAELLRDQDRYHTRADLRKLWEIQGGRCYYSGEVLGESFERARISVEHITPLSQGGHDGPSNLALVTHQINSLKNAMSKRRFLSRHPRTARQLARMKRINKERLRLFRGTRLKSER